MKIGLVLAGGGARGAYEVGTWKALRELNIEKYIEVISGTSIGALNAMLFLQGDLKLAEELWCNISKERILPTDTKDLITRSILIALGTKNINFVKKYMPKALEAGNISRSGLIDIMNKYLDFEKISNTERVCYITCTEIPELVPKYFKVNDYDIETMKSILLATSALPMIFDSEEVGSNKYLDGGMVDNTPVQPIYGENCDIIIIVHLAKVSNINKGLYPNTKFIDIIPSVIDEGLIDGVLDFTPEGSRKRMKQGYEDAISYLSPIMEVAVRIYKDQVVEDCEKALETKEIEKKNKKMFFNILKEKLNRKNVNEKERDM